MNVGDTAYYELDGDGGNRPRLIVAKIVSVQRKTVVVQPVCDFSYLVRLSWQDVISSDRLTAEHHQQLLGIEA